jgi:hypothetical protein
MRRPLHGSIRRLVDLPQYARRGSAEERRRRRKTLSSGGGERRKLKKCVPRNKNSTYRVRSLHASKSIGRL